MIKFMEILIPVPIKIPATKGPKTAPSLPYLPAF